MRNSGSMGNLHSSPPEKEEQKVAEEDQAIVTEISDIPSHGMSSVRGEFTLSTK